MDKVEEIEAAIDSPPPDQFRRIARWFRECQWRHWDEQMDLDSASGKLDFLLDEAETESKEGLLRTWPASK